MEQGSNRSQPKSAWTLTGSKLALGAVAVSLAACCTHRLPDTGPDVASITKLPALIAHRGGTGDFPENTLVAIEGSLANHADAIWLTVQLSRDGIPVLYRPADLSALTDGSGPVAAQNAAQLARLNAGWQFRSTSGDGSYPYRARPVGIPTLEEALLQIPTNVPVVLDMKALPAEPQANAVAQVLDRLDAWDRVSIYSTEAAYQTAFDRYPRARLFESRDATRQRLFGVALTGRCDAPAAGTRAGFELGRRVDVVERFTLGEGRSTFDAHTWTPASVACFRRAANVTLIAFAVNDEKTYREAACLGLDAVLVDSPATMSKVRAALAVPFACRRGER
ncbi:glycerophosphodiester phosphodiesterase family protein [Paraburkholderia phosphatilytica]|uniref:glycerophosphodiester phosphodiesterase family protein n=1 Tax=Paraburkholderia phosphatilytica TaxID=2282883 RepID=UPI000E493395|nr:glycerophosphodiester phosphodiesterase family protein [Paraburkholderia phosphatilytica]